MGVWLIGEVRDIAGPSISALCAGALKHVQEMQGFCFEVEMRTGRLISRTNQR